MNLGTAIFNTQNEQWGFWGTTYNITNNKEITEKFWTAASILIHNIASLDSTQTQNLLDSRWGRHMADEFYDEISINVETFIKAFKQKMTKVRILRDYRYYVDMD